VITNSHGRVTHVTHLCYQATRITLHSDGRRRNDRCYFNLRLLNIEFACTGHIWWKGASSFASHGCAVHKHVEDVLVKPKSLCSNAVISYSVRRVLLHCLSCNSPTSQVIYGLYSYDTVDCSQLLKIRHAKDAILDPQVRMLWPNRRQANVSYCGVQPVILASNVPTGLTSPIQHIFEGRM